MRVSCSVESTYPADAPHNAMCARKNVVLQLEPLNVEKVAKDA